MQCGEVSAGPPAATIAKLTLSLHVAGRGAPPTSRARAAVDDHRHVRLIGVVGRQLIEQLALEFAWDD